MATQGGEDAPRDFSEILGDMPDEEEIVFNDSLRQKEASALNSIMSNSDFLDRCQKKLGLDAVSQIKTVHHGLGEESKIGQAVEAVVTKYGAPHLMPSAIGERISDDSACFSLLNLLRYAGAETAAKTE
eukprot:TRINITY_DN33513_c1_g2_i1.p1 TRINITY_DN33513_c1_g2~~TRINITY_DN33513_c1_g2_i1.p1  ORF type:complete len:144 (-),score=33.69 TRINITY_DN33513_c1_g2_i1:106-492(-)